MRLALILLAFAGCIEVHVHLDPLPVRLSWAGFDTGQDAGVETHP